ncbi:STAS domain-containing protein [Streptosporangium sandarakinum]|uniref:STAS domain-containing protein n=1 Tax=Streptosporangium sandarakinum TaxID=1260955 RepID=UPI0033A47977
MLEKTPLRTEVRSCEPGTALLVLTGDLDYDTAAELVAAAQEVLGGGVSRLDLDLSGLDFVDSSGLAALINVHNVAREQEAGLRIVALTSYLRHLFQVTALNHIFELPA